MPPKISVIIPVYNVEKYIERAVRSAINQTFKDIEILIIDDCGQDNSMQIAEDFAKADSRIKILKHEKNKGLGEARNTGIEQAEGDYICFLDSDDYIEKELLEITYETARRESADIVAFGSQTVYDDNKKQLFLSSSLNPACNLEALELLSENKIGFMAWDKLYRTKLLSDFNIRFLPILHEDITFAIENIYHSSKTVVIPDIFYNYFQRESSLSNIKKVDERYFKSYFEVVKQVSKFVDEKNIYKESPDTARLIERGILIWLLNRITAYYSYGMEKGETDLLFSVLYETFGSNGYFIYSMFEFILELTGAKPVDEKTVKMRIRDKLKKIIRSFLK